MKAKPTKPHAPKSKKPRAKAAKLPRLDLFGHTKRAATMRDRRKRRRRNRLPPGFILQNEAENIAETIAGMALVDMLRKAGIRPTMILAGVSAALRGVGLKPDPDSKCACKGTCACHTGIQIAAVPCPPGCPNAGTRFDGCHRCDCSSSGKESPKP